MISSSLSRCNEKSVLLFLKVFEKQSTSFARSTQQRHCSVQIKGFWRYELSALILMWQFWVRASWETQHKAPAQMHFIITITDDSLKRHEILVLLWIGRMSFLLPSTFHLHYFSSACHSIWKKLWEQIHCLHRRLYHDRFSDSINHIYTSNSLGQPKKPSSDLLQFRLTRLLVASHFHGCSCQVYHRAIKRPWRF